MGDRELITAPKGSPSSWLRQLAQAADQSDDLNEVCAGLDELELITQFTSLCLGKASGTVSASDSAPTWLALAERLGLEAADCLEQRLEMRCEQIDRILRKYLEKTAIKQP